MNHKKRILGFTLIELLLVMAVMGVLFTIAIIAFNPAKQFMRARNAQRNSDVSLILNAIGAYSSDNKGVLPSGITATSSAIASSPGGANICSDIMPKYVSSLPADPSLGGTEVTNCTSYSTGYFVSKDAYNRVTVSAPSAEDNQTISITR